MQPMLSIEKVCEDTVHVASFWNILCCGLGGIFSVNILVSPSAESHEKFGSNFTLYFAFERKKLLQKLLYNCIMSQSVYFAEYKDTRSNTFFRNNWNVA